MDLENRTGIPGPIYRVFNRWYNNHPTLQPTEFSATEVLNSAKQIYLRRNYEDSVKKDIQNVMKPIIGTWMHYAMSNALFEEEDCIVERRFKRDLHLDNTFGDTVVTLSGGVDLLYRDDQGLHIIDYKNTNQAKIDKAAQGEDTSFLDQMYIYAWLIEGELGERPVDATIVAQNTLLRVGEINLEDPSKRPIQMLSFGLDDMEYQEELLSKIKVKISKVISNDIPQCSEDEMWMTERLYGIKKPENQKYNKKCASLAEANQFLIEKGWAGKGYTITEIIPEPKKCRSFCDYLPWCKQGQEAVERYINSNKENSNG